MSLLSPFSYFRDPFKSIKIQKTYPLLCADGIINLFLEITVYNQWASLMMPKWDPRCKFSKVRKKAKIRNGYSQVSFTFIRYSYPLDLIPDLLGTH